MRIPLEPDDLLWSPTTGAFMYQCGDTSGRPLAPLPPFAELVIRARHATRLTCASFADLDEGRKRAECLLVWLQSSTGTLKGVATRIFRECPQQAVQDVLLSAIDALPDDARYELTGTIAFEHAGSDVEISFRHRLHAANASRARRGMGRLGVSAQEQLLAALRGTHEGYWNHCWKCEATVEEGFNEWCSDCGWLICICGACRDPRWGGCARVVVVGRS